MRKNNLTVPAAFVANAGLVMYAILILLWGFTGYVRLYSPETLFLTREGYLFVPGDDRSYFEAFQYMFLGWTSLASLYLVRKKREKTNPIPWIWLFLFLDDFLLLHDRYGSVYFEGISNFIAVNAPFVFDFIRVKDITEVTWWIFVAIVIIASIFCLRKNIQTWDKALVKSNLMFFLSLAFFGVFVDVVHANLNSGIFVKRLLALVEESGEFNTALAAFVYHLNLLTKFTDP